MVPRLIAAWNRFWFEPIAPYGLAAFRVVFGGYLLIYFLAFLPHVEVMFSSAGVYVPVLVRDLAPPPAVARALYGALIAALVLFVLGWRTRFVTPVVLLLFLHHWQLNIAIANTSYDRLSLLFLVAACFGRLDAAWALSAPSPAPRVSPFAARLIALQLAFLYLGTGLWKLVSPPWHDPKMIEMTMLGPYATGAAFWFVQLGWPAWVYSALAWGTIAYELAAGFGLWIPRVRWLFIAGGIALHGGIWLFLGIPQFLVCWTAYVLFLDPEALAPYALRSRFGGR